VLQDAAAHQVHGGWHMATQRQKRQQQDQTQHRAGYEGQGELGEQFAKRLEDEELNEALDHGLSV
jgi:hypothetical protein